MAISNEKKWVISIISALIFVLIALPQTFQFTNSIFKQIFGIKTINYDGNPTTWGLVIHGAVFALITRGLMETKVNDMVIQMVSNEKKN
jgi:uncharacterized membrane protein